MAMLWAPRCVAKVETMHVARIMRIVPLSTLSLSSRIGSPVGRVAQDDVVAHHDGGERGRHVGAAQSEDDGPLVFREAEALLREPCGDEFRRRDERDHDRRHLDALPSRGRRPGSR